MEKTGLLVLSNPSKISRILPAVKEYVQKTLYVQLSPQRHLVPPWVLNGEPTLKPPHFRNLVVGIYSQASSISSNLDIRILLACLKNPYQRLIDTRKKVDIVIFDKKYTSDEVSKFLQHCLPNKTSTCQVVTLNENPEEEHGNRVESCPARGLSEIVQPIHTESKIYDSVVLGGTFDRLHSGHKILLSVALLHCSKKLTVGVTNAEMLRSKKLWELIEPCEKRIEGIYDFLQDIDSSLDYDVVPIGDPFGPTKDDPTFQMIVVSSETFRGGQRVNDLRQEKGLPLLDILSIELLETEPSQLQVEESKISSSNYRIKLLGSRLREPEPRQNIEDKPYIIGLTGSIASGKSSVAKRLEGLGAGIIDCDALAHGLYSKEGGPCYEAVVEAFGKDILDCKGEVDRKVLGPMVFSDKAQLERLNSILWPTILERSKERAQQLLAQGCSVVVMDAAVLIQAGWHHHCHETWVCIIPPAEAVKRLQCRNKLPEDEAKRRIAALPSNEELVGHANVVLSTFWEPDFTQLQVEKAWTNLLNYLKSKSKL